MAWGGIPSDLRPKAWKLLLVRVLLVSYVIGLLIWYRVQGLLPTNKERQASVITRKRKEYRGFVDQFFGERAAYRTDKDKQTLRDVRPVLCVLRLARVHLLRARLVFDAQVVVDVPRTCPDMPLFHTEFVQRVRTSPV